jgi:stage II sporulation protein D
MRHCAGWVCRLYLLYASLAAAEGPRGDGGGRDVSVAIFSARRLQAVTVTPVGASTWIARCARCAHMAFPSTVHMAGTKELFAGGTLRVSDDASGEARTATGLWHLRGRDGEVDVVLTLPSERYVAVVLNAEAGPEEPVESLRALAVVARTYGLNGRHYAARPGHLAAELCDSTECQVMNSGPVSQAVEEAVRATAGETLWFGSQRGEAFFSQSCGGATEDAGAVWPGLHSAPYLRGHADPYCVRRGSAQWHAEIPVDRLEEIARVEGWKVPAKIAAAHVVERSASRRALKIAFTGSDGATAAVSASALRFGVSRALGWSHIRSDAYELGVRNGALVFDGRGHGHGVGLCQEGAAEMASEGKSVREILAFYFPGTAVRIAPNDDGWEETRVGALTLRATHPFAAERRAAVERQWSEAQRRFPPRRALAPQIVFAPTTEVFRQLTAEPGWALASTRGATIVLQPDAVLHAHGRDGTATLTHEMLHVLVEDEVRGRVPMWLREGLVEVLAGEPERPSEGAMSTVEIERALVRTDSLRESEVAHRAAVARVRVLLARYGLSAVRGWLSSGVPADAL